MYDSDYFRAKEEALERKCTHYVGSNRFSLNYLRNFDDDDFMYARCGSSDNEDYDVTEEDHVSDEW